MCSSNNVGNVLFILQDVLRFWLSKGVDGFRIDAAKHLFEAEDLSQNEPANPNATSDASAVRFV